MSIFLNSCDIFQNPKGKMDGHHFVNPFPGFKGTHLPVSRAWGKNFDQ
jgi:hypothetical protein